MYSQYIALCGAVSFADHGQSAVLQERIYVMIAHRTRWWAGIALLPALLTTDVTAAETGVRLSLDYEIDGRAAAFLLPFDKGYYKAEGVNVSIDPASGSLETIERVASGNYEMGLADINSFIKFRDSKRDVPIKAVFMLYNRPPFAVIGRKSRGVSQPKDLEGKILGAPAADGAYAQWPIFARVNNIDVSTIKIEIVSFPVREPMLDYGVELYGNAIIVNSKFADQNPDAVKGFLTAFMKGLKETVKQPSIAIGSVLKRNSEAKKNVELERLTMAIRENIITPEVKENGYGVIDEERFARAIEQISVAYKFKAARPKLEDVFDPSFLPPAAARKYN
jgi:NitT/TauT family transport system substrate-binding protein